MLELIDRVRNDPAALEGRGDVESFLDELEELARSLEESPKKPPKAATVRGQPVSFARPLVAEPGESDNLAFIERTVNRALSATPDDVDLAQVLDALWREMQQLDAGMLSGQVLRAERVAEAYARLNRMAQQLVEQLLRTDRRTARRWFRNLLYRPKRLDLGRFEDELRG